MAEDSAKYEHKLRADSPRQILGILFCFVFAKVAKDAGGIPYPPAFVLGAGVVYSIDYWISPKPPVGFLVWLFKVWLFMAYLVFGIWLVPIMLSKVIWRPLAFGIPAFLVGLSLRWIPSIYPIKRDDSWMKTLLLSCGLAIVFALIGAFASIN